MSTDQPTDPHAPEQALPVEAAPAPAADAQAHAPEAPHEQTVSAAEQELSDMKLVVLESAELANRSANMATHAGAELKGEIGRAHVRTPVTATSRMPSSA